MAYNKSERPDSPDAGKSGKNAHALRTLINAFAYIHKMNRVKINISAF